MVLEYKVAEIVGTETGKQQSRYFNQASYIATLNAQIVTGPIII